MTEQSCESCKYYNNQLHKEPCRSCINDPSKSEWTRLNSGENMPTQPTNNYAKLKDVLDRAYSQASEGKGKERHADDNAFEDQPICSLSRLLHGHRSLDFQIVKKFLEADRLLEIKGKDAAVRELLGVVNYLAAKIILIEEE